MMAFLLLLLPLAALASSQLHFESVAVVGSDFSQTSWGESPSYTIALGANGQGILCMGNNTVRGSMDGGLTFAADVSGFPRKEGTGPHVPIEGSRIERDSALSVAADKSINLASPGTEWITPDSWRYRFHPHNGSFTISQRKEKEGRNGRTVWQGFPVPTWSFRVTAGGITEAPTKRKRNEENHPSSDVKEYIAVVVLIPWNGQGHCCNATVQAFKSVDGGNTWNWTGQVASKASIPVPSDEGPNECNVVTLKDGKTLFSVFRIDGGDGWPSHRKVPYGTAKSEDGGYTWRWVAQLPAGVGAVKPKLRRLDPSGALLLSGGRPGLKVWFNAEGDGAANGWKEYDVPTQHNSIVLKSNKMRQYAFCPQFLNASTCVKSWSQSTCYTTLNALGNDTTLLCYERQGKDVYGIPMPKECEVPMSTIFCMRIRAEI